ncbi:hypothetical protein HG536_0A07170 [Torulaspora globosa]|uniref:Genetic interactor of prohibitins 3, mitochondrial n=1 Tax=Torulaspora globosa TaxID=48254 RepID=A0A7G3ZBL6_9SACH|nr:uncharacterized protein HG536_0A07170 [Torulaspora globosa]QLL30902.1 hypothetical protein HG536_0A07170 [Torulaspora globosa]
MLSARTRLGSFRVVGTCFRRFINCNACGIVLQDKDPARAGFYIKPKRPIVNRLAKLEDVKYLLFSQELQKAKDSVPVGSLDELRKSKSHSLSCKRCNDALHSNRYTKEGFARFSFDQVLEFVPRNSNVVHVASLPEFPFHLVKKVLQDANFKSSLVLTKGDQLVKDKATLQRKVDLFFRDFLKYHLRIPTNKVIATSAIRKWNIPTVYANLSSSSYLLGNANVGKSTLINGLLQKFPGSKMDGEGLASTPTETGQLAGVLHIPNMTRNLQAFKVADKVINDLPGFTTDLNEVDLEDIIEREWLDKIRKTDQFKVRKLKKKTYISLRGTENGGCLTLGGIFFLVPPPETINQVVKYIPGAVHQFANVAKGLEVFKLCKESPDHALAKSCGIKPNVCSIDAYARHIIPPFQGSIEIVFKDIGYVLLRSTGKYNFTKPYEIWVPKGIDVCVREPLSSLIEEGYENSVESRGKKPACPRSRPLVSSTYIVPQDETNPLERMKLMYLQRTERDLSSRRHHNVNPWDVVKTLHDEPPNLYWHYKW